MNITRLRQFTWELPQSLLGYILTKIYSEDLLFTEEYASASVHIYKDFPGGISLGRYILVKDYAKKTLEKTVKHEFGHCIQSKYLGWLYLPVVGVCSGLHALTYKARIKWGWIKSYYDYWTEKWADKLGEVER